MVENVVGFPPEIKAIVLFECEALEETEIEVQAARRVQSVTPDIAKGEAGGRGVGSRIKELRTAEKLVFQITAFKKGQGIDVTEREIVALVEIGAAAISGNIIRIHERPVETVRRIVDGMAVSVCDAQSEIAHCAAP